MSDDLAVDALRIHPDFVLLAELEPIAHELIVRYANPAAVSILGRPISEIIGRPLRTLMVDEPAMASPELRKAFFARMREQGTVEFTTALTVRGDENCRRSLRVRLRFEPGQSRLVAVGEDVTLRRARDENANAAERLRASKELSQLLNHHVNNALAGALLSIETAREELGDGGQSSGQVIGLLESTAEGITAGAQVLAALATTQELDAEAAGSSDLARALGYVVASLAPRVQLSEPAPSRPANAPAWVWGGARQLDMILTGVLAHAARYAPGDCTVTLSRQADNVNVQIRVAPGSSAGAAPSSPDHEAWLRPLLDPGGAHPGLGSSPVRLFASTLVLHAIGGHVELPRLHGSDAAIELCFRAAPGELSRPESPVRVLIVSSDGALRGAVATLLSPWPIEHGDSLRDGILRIMRLGGGVVICDVDSLGITAPQLLAFERAVTDLGVSRLIVTSRRASLQPAAAGTLLAIPFSREQLLEAMGRVQGRRR